jgi:hypothetical protein
MGSGRQTIKLTCISAIRVMFQQTGYNEDNKGLPPASP